MGFDNYLNMTFMGKYNILYHLQNMNSPTPGLNYTPPPPRPPANLIRNVIIIWESKFLIISVYDIKSYLLSSNEITLDYSY